jgi:hypothetical protein
VTGIYYGMVCKWQSHTFVQEIKIVLTLPCKTSFYPAQVKVGEKLLSFKGFAELPALQLQAKSVTNVEPAYTCIPLPKSPRSILNLHPVSYDSLLTSLAPVSNSSIIT